jgi:soluble epoxide hydrolase/lipid-phosphate phosphatase
MWYVRGIDNLGVEEELAALKKHEIRQSLRINTLMVAGLRDKVCPADRARVSMNGTVDGGEKGGNLRVVDVDAGHWIMLEKADETNRVLGEFFENTGAEVRSLL